MEQFKHEGPPNPQGPTIELEIDEGELVRMTWFNTVIRTFDDETYNHVEYHTESGLILAMSVTQDFMDMLYDYQFPIYSLPYVDQATYEWYVAKETSKIDQDIDGFANGT